MFITRTELTRASRVSALRAHLATNRGAGALAVVVQCSASSLSTRAPLLRGNWLQLLVNRERSPSHAYTRICRCKQMVAHQRAYSWRTLICSVICTQYMSFGYTTGRTQAHAEAALAARQPDAQTATMCLEPGGGGKCGQEPIILRLTQAATGCCLQLVLQKGGRRG